MIYFEGTGADVSAIMISLTDGDGTITLEEPDEPLSDPAVVLAETMGIAMVEHIAGDKFNVIELHCYAPAHGSHPKFAKITKLLAPYNKRQNKNITCPMCSNRGWLPAGGSEAKTAASLSVSLGVFRGVELPKTDELKKAQETAINGAFPNVFDHSLVTRIGEKLKDRVIGADEKG